jgi:hypothetical protein
LFSPPFLPLFVKFCPCCARFEPSDVYGAVPSATTLVIAYRAGHLCPSRACQPQIASRLIVARWLGRYGFGMAGCVEEAMVDLSARRNLLS